MVHKCPTDIVHKVPFLILLCNLTWYPLGSVTNYTSRQIQECPSLNRIGIHYISRITLPHYSRNLCGFEPKAQGESPCGVWKPVVVVEEGTAAAEQRLSQVHNESFCYFSCMNSTIQMKIVYENKWGLQRPVFLQTMLNCEFVPTIHFPGSFWSMD